jgi:hypothetical protein
MASKSHTPWVMEDSLVLPPASAFAALLTITAVMGSPPNRPLIILPVPCATSSLFCEIRLYGSILSIASILSRVSSVATKQIQRHFSDDGVAEDRL